MIRIAIGLVCLILALPAFGAAEGESPGLFSGDLGNMIWTLVTFVSVLLVLGKFAWKPLLATLQEREKFIHDNLSKAQREREAAEARLKEYEAKLLAARAEATEIVEEGRRDAVVVKQRIEDEARTEAEKMLARARREIDVAKDTALKEIYAQAGRLATGAASKIIRKELTAEDHERLIRESIAELDSAAN